MQLRGTALLNRNNDFCFNGDLGGGNKQLINPSLLSNRPFRDHQFISW